MFVSSHTALMGILQLSISAQFRVSNACRNRDIWVTYAVVCWALYISFCLSILVVASRVFGVFDIRSEDSVQALATLRLNFKRPSSTCIIGHELCHILLILRSRGFIPPFFLLSQYPKAAIKLFKDGVLVYTREVSNRLWPVFFLFFLARR